MNTSAQGILKVCGRCMCRSSHKIHLAFQISRGRLSAGSCCSRVSRLGCKHFLARRRCPGMKQGGSHRNATGFGCYWSGDPHILWLYISLEMYVEDALPYHGLLASFSSICAVANGVNVPLWLIVDASACATMASVTTVWWSSRVCFERDCSLHEAGAKRGCITARRHGHIRPRLLPWSRGDRAIGPDDRLLTQFQESTVGVQCVNKRRRSFLSTFLTRQRSCGLCQKPV